MIRSSRHRRRHKPPGPCGVLWSMTQTKPPRDEEEELDKARPLLFENGESSLKPNNHCNDNNNNNPDTLTPPAWNAMLQSLNIPTPYIPMSTRGNIPKRYEILRKHLPPNFVLLQEILQGNHDLQMHPNHYLCAWVETIEEQNSHHGIWTVGLKDETGAQLRAWMEPNFVREELQKTTQDALLGVVRVGVVWRLSNFSIIANPNNNNNSSTGKVERMLVVSGNRIETVWTPESKQIQPTEDEDTPQAQQKYLEWMAKRNALTMDEPLLDDDEEMPEQENESLVEKQVRMNELSALTMTVDDDHSDEESTSSNHRDSTANPLPVQPQLQSAQAKANESRNENNNQESQSLLQTQESTRIESKTDTISQQQTSDFGQRKRKKTKQKPVSPTTPTRTSPKRRKSKSPARNSPIRMSQSVWNTPDPSILEMLECDSETVDETPTVVDEEPSLTFTQFSNKPPSLEPRKTEHGDDSLLPTGRAFVGSNLFEPSSWKGVDATAFSESDSE